MTRITWDPEKAAKVFRTRGIRFEDAYQLFEDIEAYHTLNSLNDGEVRYQSTGTINNSRIVTFIYTVRDEDTPQETIRLITAWNATAEERREYYNQSAV